MKAELISHCRILDKLGAGGMGEVFLAEDQKLKRKVALRFGEQTGMKLEQCEYCDGVVETAVLRVPFH